MSRVRTIVLVARGLAGRPWNPLWPLPCRGTQQELQAETAGGDGGGGCAAPGRTHTVSSELLRVTLGLTEPRREEAERHKSYLGPRLSPACVAPFPERLQLHSQKYPGCCDSGSCSVPLCMRRAHGRAPARVPGVGGDIREEKKKTGGEIGKEIGSERREG